MKDAYTIIRAYNSNAPTDLQSLKYQAIQENEIRFLRGTCHLFYQRFAHHYDMHREARIWICGDLHVENFGCFKGDNRQMYFDLNDFDEAAMATPAWEMVRFLTAWRLVARHYGLSKKENNQLVEHSVDTYISAILASHAYMVERETAEGSIADLFRAVAARDRAKFIKAHTRSHRSQLMLKIDGQKLVSIDQNIHSSLLKEIESIFALTPHLSGFKPIDISHRIAGTGSLGATRYAILVHHQERDKYYLLDLKQALTPSWHTDLPTKQPKWDNSALRIMTIQRRLQYCAPALLTPIRLNGEWYVLRELQPKEDKIDILQENIGTHHLYSFSHTLSQLTAYAHLRGTGRQGADTADELAATVATHKWRKQIIALTDEMINQTMKDFKAFKKEYRD